MSVIQKIRDKGAWIISSLIALAIIAFLLQDGFGNGGARGSIFSSDVVGKVNGVKLTRNDVIEQQGQMEQKYGQRLQQAQAIPEIWRLFVDKAVFEKETKKLGLTTTAKDLEDMLFGDNPPQWWKQGFTDPATGQFDVAKARQSFAQLKKQKGEQLAMIMQAYINPELQQRVQQKYQQMIAGAAYAPKWMAEKTNADNNSIASFSYVFVPYSTLSDSAFKVSDDEVKAYMNAHKAEFQQEEESRSIQYITFDAFPSAADTAAVKNQLESLKPEFAAASNMEAFIAKTSSDMPYYNGFIAKKEIKHNFKDSIVKVGVGNIYGPYIEGKNAVIARVIAARSIPDTVKVRHILVATKERQQDGTMMPIRLEDDAKKLADSLATAIKNGTPFDSLVSKFSDDPGSKDKGGVYENVVSGQMVGSFNDFCFTGKVGDKGVVKTDFGFHYMEVLSQKGNTEAYKIAYVSKPINASAETDNAASTAASKFSIEAKDKKTFDTAVSKLGKFPMMAEMKENDYYVNGLGENREFIRWVYSNKAGSVSEPTQFADKYVVAIIAAVNEKGMQSVATARPRVENFVRNEKKAKQIIETKFKGTSLEAYAQSAGVTVLRADSMSFANAFIPNVGSDVKVTGAAFNKELQGKASTPIAGAAGVIAIKGEMIGARAAATDIEGIRKSIQNQQKQYAYRAGDILKKAANITDKRSKFF